MIITKQKPFDELLKTIGHGPVFLVGCSECATLCHTGGEEELIQMKAALEQQNVRVLGWIVLDPACHLQNNKRLLKVHLDSIEKAQKILVLACGNGVQTVAEQFLNKDVLSGTDTLFLGEIKRITEFEKRCSLCGHCLLDDFEGFCPVSRCPKAMLNGPCGGTRNGKCELATDMDCVWVRIYEQLKTKQRSQQLLEIQPPKKWARSLETRRKV